MKKKRGSSVNKFANFFHLNNSKNKQLLLKLASKKGNKSLLKIKDEDIPVPKPPVHKSIRKTLDTHSSIRPVHTIPKKEIIKQVEPQFIKTYIPGVDNLINKGVPFGSSILVEGGPGSGKTLFCLTLLKNLCEKGKKVLYMSFEEPEVRLLSHLKFIGAKPEEYQKKGLLYVKRFNALDIARSVEALLSEAKKELLIDVQPVLIPPDFTPDIVLIDSLSSIGSAFSGEENRFRIYMEQLFRYLESHGITSFLIRETANPTHIGAVFVEKGEAVSFLSDGIIVLYSVFYSSGIRKRGIEVLKMRGTDINTKIVECEIKKGKGVVVYPNKILKGKYILT